MEGEEKGEEGEDDDEEADSAAIETQDPARIDTHKTVFIVGAGGEGRQRLVAGCVKLEAPSTKRRANTKGKFWQQSAEN